MFRRLVPILVAVLLALLPAAGVLAALAVTTGPAVDISASSAVLTGNLASLDTHKSVNWNPSRGSEQKGTRPALVIQNDIGNAYSSTTIVASISTKFNKVYPFQVLIRAKETGLDTDSVVDLQQIMTVDKTHLAKKIGQIKDSTIPLINTAIINSLEIT